MGNIFGRAADCQEKRHLAVKFPLEIHPGKRLYAVQCLYIAVICGAQLIFSCMSLTERPICRQIVIHKSQSARKGGCQRTATRTYLHWLQFIFRASEWVNSYFTLLNVPLCQMRNTKWWIKTFHIFILTWSFGLFGYMTALPCGLYICNTSGCPGGLQDYSPLLKVKPLPCLDRLDIASPKNYLILHLPRKSRWRPKR